ncbi:MAG: single-stranded DNA-binding protein [Bacteroides sp.]|nr:single-stranded DNA-binding protein [Ruminococcus flavefaciens]MCM1555144.1 single-stranded DNA-binding protein [Bacteroides sp.]
MSGVNKVILIGNLGKDPEVYVFDNGSKRARLTLATTEYYRSRQGDRVEHTEWHSVVLYGGLAEVSEKYLKKGMKIYVEGRLRTRTWEDKGQKRYYVEVEAKTMEMLGKKDEKPAVLKGVEAMPSIPPKIEGEPEYDPEEDVLPF